MDEYADKIIEIISNNKSFTNLFDKLCADYDPVYVRFLMYAHAPNNSKSEVANRLHAHKFRLDVISRYGSCIVTSKPAIICEAAHIVPYSESNYLDSYSVNNGLLLCRDLHVLFDTRPDLFSINPESFQVVFSDDFMNDPQFLDYHKYQNKKLKINPKSARYLRDKYHMLL